MTRFHPTQDIAPEPAWLIATTAGDQPLSEVEESLRELRSLARTAEAEVTGETLCRLKEVHPGTYIGRGKADAIADEIRASGIQLIIFDDELTPAQGRNLEELFGIRVLDRTQLILDIFARRARTQEGRLQIELAQLQYLIPRLRGLWTHLERQRGGIGLKGPGEKQLEMDRRHIEQRIRSIRSQLNLVRQRREELRRGRRRHGWALLTLVGYTNAGKSTLLNQLTEAGVLADDQLFATLDPTTRRLQLAHHQPCLLTDTVGFIRKLPHHLVEAFKATLEEVNEADLLLHVIDASHPRASEQIAAVQAVLRELGAGDKPVIAVFNKTDLEQGENQAIRLADAFPHSVRISALTGEGTVSLCQSIEDLLRERIRHLKLRIPAAEGRWLALLHAKGNILHQQVEGDILELEALLPVSMASAIPEDWILNHTK